MPKLLGEEFNESLLTVGLLFLWPLGTGIVKSIVNGAFYLVGKESPTRDRRHRRETTHILRFLLLLIQSLELSNFILFCNRR